MVPLRTSNLPEHATQIPDVPPACDSSVPSRGGLPEPTHRPTSGMVTSELSTFRAGLKPVTQANSAPPTQLRAANPERVIRSATRAGYPSRPTGERFRTHRVPPPIRPQTLPRMVLRVAAVNTGEPRRIVLGVSPVKAPAKKRTPPLQRDASRLSEPDQRKRECGCCEGVYGHRKHGEPPGRTSRH
jgi:hypothetical protein